MFTMRFEGGEELARNLNALSAALRKKIVMAALMDAGQPMAKRASQLAPREPGAPDLADNIIVSAASRVGSIDGGLDRAREEGEYAVAVGPTKYVFYGLFQEFGTVRHGAHEFMRPAFDAVAPQSLGIIGQQLWQAVRAQIRPVSAPAFGGGRFGMAA